MIDHDNTEDQLHRLRQITDEVEENEGEVHLPKEYFDYDKSTLLKIISKLIAKL